MIHFIVSDKSCRESKSIGLYPYKKLIFTRCNPKMVDKVREGLQGMSKNYVPVFNVDNWQEHADKLLTGK